MKKLIQQYPLLKFIIAPVVFILLLLLSQVALKGARIDLTEQNVYSLSNGTENILNSLEQKRFHHVFL